MLNNPRFWAGTAFVGGLALLESPAAADDKDEKVPIDKLPKAVIDAARKYAKDADWKQATKQTEDKEVWYELVGVLGTAPNKRLVTLEIDDDGEVFYASKMIALSDVPKDALKAFQAKFPKKPKYVFEVVDGTGEEEVTTYEFVTTRPAPAAKGKKGKGKKDKEEEITVVVSEDGKSVEVQGEGD